MNLDFSHLVSALKENDTESINKHTKVLYKRLVSYLRFSMNASKADAEDCVQDALLSAFGSARMGRLKNPKLFYFYTKKICRNNYLNVQKRKNVDYLEEVFINIAQEPPQMQDLINKERTRYLIWCFDQLPEDHKSFIQYWYDHPNIHTKKVAEYFGISISNAWTKKHRLIRKLQECHQKKINQ